MRASSARLLAVVAIGFIAASCDLASSSSEQLRFDARPVRVDIDGREFAFPLGFFWGDFVKRGRWPEPSPEVRKVTSIEVFSTWPALAPYSPETRHLFDDGSGLEQVVQITLTSETNGRRRSIEDQFADLRSQSQLMPGTDESLGLAHNIFTRGPEPSRWVDYYTPVDASPAPYYLRCERNAVAKCELLHYAADDLPQYQVRFSRTLLPRWLEVDEKTAALLRSSRR